MEMTIAQAREDKTLFVSIAVMLAYVCSAAVLISQFL
jgi:hypothetical protein